MTRFIDSYLDRKVVGYPTSVAPMFSTTLVTVDSGAEQANQRWANPLRDINVSEGVRDHETFEALKAHWLVMGGPAHTWPFRDPTDFASRPLEQINQVPSLSRTDTVFGVGNGIDVEFQLSKRYTVGGQNYDRPIRRPIVSTVIVGIDGADPATLSPPITFTVDRNGGMVEFNAPPGVGDVLTAGFLFDLDVRFESDETFRSIMRTFGVSGFADIPLREVLYCGD